MNDKNFNELLAEQNELSALIEEGIEFKTPIRSVLRFFSKTKTRTFRIRQFYLGSMHQLGRETIGMDFSEESLKADPFGESKRLASANARRCSRIVAIAVLNDKWMIRLFAGWFADYFLWRITPSELIDLTIKINQLSNLGDFINSIRLLSINRISAPNRIEENQNPAD